VTPREIDAMLERHRDNTAEYLARYDDAGTAAPAPRRGTNANSGKEITRSDKARLRTRIGNAVRRAPGTIADIYSSAIAKDLGVSKSVVRKELEEMIKKKLLIEVNEFRGGRWYDNIYPPVYKIFGREVTLRELARHERNVHKLSYNTIRQRLLAGMEPREALATPPKTRGEIAAIVARSKQVSSGEEDEGSGW